MSHVWEEGMSESGYELRKKCKELGYVNFVQAIVHMNADGKSEEEIAEVLGRSQLWVSHTMRCLDIPVRKENG